MSPLQSPSSDTAGVGVMAPQLLRIDVDLDHRCARLWDGPVPRDLTTGLAADETHEVGLKDGAVGALALIQAHHADGKRMITGDAVLGIQ